MPPVATAIVQGAARQMSGAGTSVTMSAAAHGIMSMSAAMQPVTLPGAGKHVQLYTRSTALCTTIASLPSLQRPYPFFRDPLQWALGPGHMETLWGSLARRCPDVPFTREVLPAHDGGSIALDWHAGPDVQALTPTAPILVLAAGLTGGSDARYVRHATLAAIKRGYRTVVYNHTGVAGSPVTSPRLYCAAYTEDMRDGVHHVSSLFPGAPILMAGWSIGANVLVHFLAEEAALAGTAGYPALAIRAACSMCNPFELQLGHENWTGPKAGFRRMYDFHLASKMRKLFRTHLHLFSQQDQGQAGLQQGRQERAPTAQEQAGAATDVRDIVDIVVEVQQANATKQSAAGATSTRASTDSSSKGSIAESTVTDSSASSRGEVAAAGAAAGAKEAVRRAVRGALYPRQGPVIAKAAAAARTVHDFDKAATIHWFGFESVSDYFRAASSAYCLHKVQVPTLCIQALDDPIAPEHAIPYSAFAENELLALLTTSTGGHLGWVGGRGGLLGAPWTDDVMLDFFDAQLAQLTTKAGQESQTQQQELNS